MKIPDHVLKKYAPQTANQVLTRLDFYNVPEAVRDAIWEAVDGGAEFDENYDRLIELLETAHVELFWTNETK